jgi:lipopolysaccharide biosynthesis regulator YciM
MVDGRWRIAIQVETALLAIPNSRDPSEMRPFTLHALAAAYAETNNYPKAIETARRALVLADQRQLPDLAPQLRSEIALYELNLPVRERM